MEKKFVQITQTYTLTAIMNVSEGETEESLAKRVKEHCENNGGVETVITGGSNITCSIENGVPTCEDESVYECID